MEPQTKEKFNWSRFGITVGLVLLAAFVVGGTTWYIMDQNAKDIKSSNDKSISALQSQIDTLNKKIADSSNTTTDSTTDSANSTTSVTANWKIYTNTSFDFTAKYPTDYFFSEATPVEISAAGDLFFVNFYNNAYKTSPDTTSPLKVEVFTNTGDDLKTWIAFNYKGTGDTITSKTVNGMVGYTFSYYPDSSNTVMTGFATTKNGKYYSVTAKTATDNFTNFLTALTIN